ncbi:olfactory receptor 56A4-like [Bombina bombina]|uniref:olfactory receptor 56A4-like n=1 Tax=Bombina bombina TaxID=8345 RepID=UPI00235A60BB|nr:olfactory receptor 56A4-like [Bombina bombina]
MGSSGYDEELRHKAESPTAWYLQGGAGGDWISCSYCIHLPVSAANPVCICEAFSSVMTTWRVHNEEKTEKCKDSQVLSTGAFLGMSLLEVQTSESGVWEDSSSVLFDNQLLINSRDNTSATTDFILICFPEISSWRVSGILMFLLTIAVVSNVTLLIVIYADPRLHHPMYYFLAMLSVADILLCTVATPKVLAIFWSNDLTISPAACFLQMFFTHLWSSMESSIFLVMAYDRYVAICHPLHYPSIVTNHQVGKASMFIVFRNLVLSLPLPLLAASLDYCSRREIPHCFCENMSVEKLSCSDYSASSIYSLVVFFVVGGADLMFIIFSYSVILHTVVISRSCAAAFKAFRTCSSHLILICFFYITIAITMLSNRALKELPRHIHVILALLHHLLPPALNPLVYGIMTKEIKHAIWRLLEKIKVHPQAVA